MKKIVLYGIGEEFGKWYIALHSESLMGGEIVGYSDRDSSKKNVAGVKFIDINSLNNVNADLIVVCVRDNGLFEKIKNQLQEIGICCEVVKYDEYIKDRLQLNDDIHKFYKCYRCVEEIAIRTGKIPETFFFLGNNQDDLEKVICATWEARSDVDADICVIDEKEIHNIDIDSQHLLSLIIFGNMMSEGWKDTSEILSSDFYLYYYDLEGDAYKTISLWIKKDNFKDIMAKL